MGGAYFDGVGSRIIISNGANLPGTDISVVICAKGVRRADFDRLMQLIESPTKDGWDITTTSTYSYLYFRIEQAGVPGWLGGPSLPANITRENELQFFGYRFYQNGANAAGDIIDINGNIRATWSTAYTLNFQTVLTDIYIGGSTLNFKGTIYYVAYFNGKITTDNISDIGLGRILPTQFDCRLWHDYRLGHARDLSGNNNHGTLNGNVRFV